MKDVRFHAIQRLRQAFERNALTLYVGAGASVANGVPGWDALVRTIYLNSLKQLQRGDPGLLPIRRAVAEVWFTNNRLPLEIMARGLRSNFQESSEFERWVRFGLYQFFGFDSKGYPTIKAKELVRENSTLRAIIRLCEESVPSKTGLKAIVTYNFDGLLEMALGSFPYQSIWRVGKANDAKLPIYHVHGFFPVKDPFSYSKTVGSTGREIVFTEDQYHREAADPYSWSNLVQLQAMSSSVGLTVGLSLADANLRRLLDAIGRVPSRPQMFALLQRPEVTRLETSHITKIEELAKSISKARMQSLPLKAIPKNLKRGKWREFVQQIWHAIEKEDLRRKIALLRELNIEPLWCRHDEILSIAESIVGARAKGRKTRQP
jgi:hypothetical protein